MGKKLFIMLIVLMSLSLIGIIFVQVFFINNSLQNEKKQFTLNVKRSLSFVSDAIEDREFREYSSKMYQLMASGAIADSTSFRELRIETEDRNIHQTIIYRNGILEESYKVPSLFLDIGLDSVNISRISSQRETTVYDRNPVEGNLNISSEKKMYEFSKLTELEKKQFELSYRDLFKNYPIYKRVSKEEVKDMLDKQLHEDGIDTEFEFAIYDKDLATKVQSNSFELIKGSTYGVPLFLDNNNESNFKLYVNFPDRNKYLFRTILGMTILSIVFTSIIIITYASAIHQLIQQ